MFTIVCYPNQSTETPFTAFVTETWTEFERSSTDELSCVSGATPGDAVEQARFAALDVLNRQQRYNAGDLMMGTATTFTHDPFPTEGR